MDRQIVYPGAIPQDTDQLKQSKNTMVALGMLSQAVLGTSTVVDGLLCTPTGPASLQVNVGPGSIYAVANVDGTSYGSLAADTADQIVKQGISLATLTLSCPAPATTGQSINYLIEAAYNDTDGGSTVLPYYNSSNPAVAYSGPSNSGTPQNTVRQGVCTVTVKAGVAATTGSQVTPAPDAGYVGLWVVTVANGQTQITSTNITYYLNAPFLPEKLNQKISIATGDTRYLKIANARIRLTGSQTFYVATTGSDTTGNGTVGSPWATLQNAWNVITNTYDFVGNTVYIQVADGTYSNGIQMVNGSITVPMDGNVIIQGNATTPSNVVISTASNNAFYFAGPVNVTVQNMKIQVASGGAHGIVADNGGLCSISVVLFGAVSGNCIWAIRGSRIFVTNNVTFGGNATTAVQADEASTIYFSSGITVTLSGTPAFSFAFLSIYSAAIVYASGLTFSGTCTGPRFVISTGGNVQTGTSGNLSYFPGSSSGALNGYYDTLTSALNPSNNLSDVSSLATALTNLGFADHSSSGYYVLPSGTTAKPIIIQWGTTPGTGTVTFPITFPTNCWSISLASYGASNQSVADVTSKSTSNFGFSSGNVTQGAMYIAIGN
jgi:hypothetical protein